MADQVSDPFVKNQALAFTRGGIYFAAGVAVGYGLLSGESALAIATGLVTLIANSGWTFLANTNTSIAMAFSQIPSNKYVETSDPKLAKAMKAADPSTEVKIVKETS